MRQVLAVALALSALSVPVYSAEKSLAHYKAIYEKESARIEQEHQHVLNRVLAGYRKSLGTIRERFKKAGDLAGSLALKKEQERFQKENSIPNTIPPDLPALIQKAQSLCHQSASDAKIQRAKKLRTLIGSYVKRLDAMKKQLVSQDKLDEAVAVESEMKRVEFVIADIESTVPKPAAPKPGHPPTPAKPSTPKPSPARKAGEELTLDLGDDVEMEFVWIPAGSFMMGSPDDEEWRQPGESPAHKVTISKGFWTGKYEVTQEQYEQVIGKNPSIFKDDGKPVEMVSWNDAAGFCEVMTRELGKTFHLPVKMRGRVSTVRLPTEAEWEYACRAGTARRFHGGDRESDLSRAGWWNGNSEKETHRVGRKKRNVWGLYDMHGNVWEWCQDWLDRSYYAESPDHDPEGPAKGLCRVFRGGGWNTSAKGCRAAHRGGAFPGPAGTGKHVGFRAVLVLEKQ